MAKKGRPIIGGWRKTPAPKPAEPMQEILMRAEELIKQDKLDVAIDLLEENLPRYGRRPAYRVMLAMLYGGLGDMESAAEHARAAWEQAPGEREVQLLAAMTLLAAGYSGLAHRARQAWLSAGLRQHSEYAEEQALEADYLQTLEHLRARFNLRNAKFTDEAMVAADEGRWALMRGQWTEALRLSRRASALIPGWPPPHNNIATALFQMRRLSEALRETEAVLRDMDPDNAHALAGSIRYALALGETDRVRAAGERLAALPLPADPEVATAMAGGLGLLDRDDDVDRICTQVRKRDGELLPVMKVYWGIAAANLGQRRKAMQRVREGIERGKASPLALETLSALHAKKPGRGMSERYSYSHYTEWASPEMMNELGALLEREAKREQRDDRGWKAFLERYPQAPRVLEKMLYESEIPLGDGNENVMGPLHALTQMRTPASLEIVRTFALGHLGQQAHRWYALQRLQEAGALPEGETVTVWINGQSREVRLIAQEVVDPIQPDYPKAAARAFEEGIEHQQAGRLDEAERCYRRILELAPDAKEAYYNLSLLYDARDEHARAEEMRDQALAIDPLYVLPLTARALHLIAGGKAEKAREALRPLLEVRKFDPFSYLTYQRAMAAIAIGEERYAEARRHLLLARDVAPDDPIIADMLSSLTIMEGMTGADSIFGQMDTRYRQRRQRARISPDPTLAECFELLTKGDMAGIARTVRLSSVSAMRVKELRERMLAVYADPGFVADIIGELNDAERRALRDLLDHGGVMAWGAFSDAHGNDLAERPYLDFWAERYETVMGRLRARALLFEGTADGRLIVAIPRELRPVVAEALAGG